MAKLLHLVSDCMMLAVCGFCYYTFVKVPWHYPWAIERLILPWAGCWAYNNSWVEFRANMAWLRAGSPRMVLD